MAYTYLAIVFRQPTVELAVVMHTDDFAINFQSIFAMLLELFDQFSLLLTSVYANTQTLISTRNVAQITASLQCIV